MVQSVFPVNNTVFLYIYVAQTYVFPIKITLTNNLKSDMLWNLQLNRQFWIVSKTHIWW